jgi:RNA recognition motif-containing protein
MNIYVSNLNYRTGDQELEQLFAEYGTVSSARIIKDRETGRSRGFGFVEMDSEEEGQKAIDGLNGTEFKERSITVSVAKERTERPERNRY